jgi:hypothetical protein
VCWYVQGGLVVGMLFILLTASPAVKFIILCRSCWPRHRLEILLLRLGGEEEALAKKPEIRGQKPVNKKPEPMNAFQAKLMELKKNFKE